MNNDELYHYGVLGMKWGVRRYQNKDGTLTSLGRQRHNAQIKAKKYDATDPNSNLGYVHSEEFNHDRTLKKGSLVYRYSSAKSEQNKGRTFVYFTKNDDIEYGISTGDGLASNGAYYKHRLLVKKDIRIPSTQHMLETYIDMMYMNPVMNLTTKDIAIRSGKKMLSSWMDENGKLTLEQAQSRLFDEANSDIYASFMRFTSTMLRGSSTDLGSSGEEFINRLTKKGYNAIPDLKDNIGDHADGYHTRFENPILVFDRESSLADRGLALPYTDGDFTERYEIDVDSRKKHTVL